MENTFLNIDVQTKHSTILPFTKEQIEINSLVFPKPEEIPPLLAGHTLSEEANYIDRRVVSYPPITDYLDGIVKNDQAQIDDYIRKCLEVKAEYPKPQ